MNMVTGDRLTSMVPKLIARDKQTSVTFTTESLVVETTAYAGWQAFRTVVEAALKARQTVAPVEGFERIGLRYIDEIRIPNRDRTLAWSEWVDGSLLGPSHVFESLELRQAEQQGIVVYATPNPGETYTLRYGAMDGPPVVGTAPNLVRRGLPEAGPFFLLDTDGAWVLGEDAEIPQLDPAAVMVIADRIHRPIKEMFELLITDRLRKEVLEIGQ